MNSFKPCRKCFHSKIEGFIETEIEGEVVLTECNCHKTWKTLQTLEIKLLKANIPLGVDLSFNDYSGVYSLKEIEKIKNYIKNFKDNKLNSSLYFYGDNGTQKTTVAWILGKELLQQGVSIFYIPTMELIVKHFGMFDNQKTNKTLEFIKKANESDLVIIDECFANKNSYSISDYQLNQLRAYFKNRLEIERKSIIFISNTNVPSIEQQGYSKTLQALIKRNTLGRVLTFKDYYSISNTEFEIDDIFK